MTRTIVIAVAAVAGTASASAATATVPSGVFRTTITNADLKAGGVSDVAENHGTYTLKLTKGRWSFHQAAPNALHAPDHSGTYAGSGAGAFRFTDPSYSVGFTAKVSFDGKHLRFKILKADIPELRVIWGAHAWTKVTR